ncbi:nucleoside hydrolase [Virgibacillus siamensis]|uniref:nucleoside hydrolase n=1 Tax=Virgibacillus siamensis TaxID=480071 RepID=UPI000987289D|nr:nucleoside hydrolase [Virgibacillus siamensis]
MVKKVLLFGDIGIDDTIALIYSFFKDEIDIIGVVADYGNISRENALANVNYIRELLDIGNRVIIMGGAENPMTGENPKYFPEIHGEYGLGPIIPPEAEENEVVENFSKVVDIINEYKDELIIVNIGRLTSLATMFILYQSLMDNIKQYYIMGGAFWVPGNVTAVSEANFYGDPIAAQIVLKYARDVTILPLNVTQKAVVTPKMTDYIDQVGKLDIIKPMLDYYYNYYKQIYPDIRGGPMHDVVTLMAIIHEDMFTYRTLPVKIVQQETGVARGQSIADIRPGGPMEEKDKVRPQRIAFAMDYKKFYMDFMTTMSLQQSD